MHRALQPSANSFPTSQRRTPAPHTPHHRPHQHQRHGWDDEDRLVSVVKQNGAGTVLLTVEFAYCPACGGTRTHKRVWNGTKTDENLVKWLQYETEGLNQLRVDEKWESQTDGNDYLDALDPWRTARVTYNGPGQISQLLKEDVYTYDSQTTGTPSNVKTIYYNYDRMGVVAGLSNGSGSELEQFESDAFGSWDGKNTWTTRRITGKEYDEDVQLYFFHARWYAVSIGVFVSRSPFNIAVEHPYAFNLQNPLLFIDASGKMVSLAPGVVGAFICGLFAGTVDDLPPEISNTSEYIDYYLCNLVICGIIGQAAGMSAKAIIERIKQHFISHGIKSVRDSLWETLEGILEGGAYAGISCLTGPIQDLCAAFADADERDQKSLPMDCQERCAHLWGSKSWYTCMDVCRRMGSNPKFSMTVQPGAVGTCGNCGHE